MMNVFELRERDLKTQPTVFCSGCGYEIVMNCFLKAIEESDKQLSDYSFVEGIGCAAWIISNYFKNDNLHTAHGRAIAFATGIKLVRPELDVIVISGDGDIAAIGGNHLIHAARKNIPLWVICLNNFNYGMTGGQFGATTPLGAKTLTTPEGNIERPFDLMQLVLGAGGQYVSRYLTVYPHLLVKGIKNLLQYQDGFAFMEIVSQCPRRFGEKNKDDIILDILKWRGGEASEADLRKLSLPSLMLIWQKGKYISKEKAKKMRMEDLKDKDVFGEFRDLKEYLGFCAGGLTG